LIRLGYKGDVVEKTFSSTKIWLQLLYELKQILTYHSAEFLDQTPTGPATDTSSFALTKSKYDRFSYAARVGAIDVINDLKYMKLDATANVINQLENVYKNVYTNVHMSSDEIRIAAIANLLSQEFKYSAGLGTKEADFDRLIGANQKESKRLKREVAAIIARSGVTIRNRSILRLQSITGGYWITQDFQKSVDRQNVIRLLDGDLDPPGGDASERYGVLPNGLFAFWLQDGKGVRQDTAPDFIASDHQTAGNDRRIHIGKSCITCHLEGLRPLDDYARKLYRGEIKLATPDYARYLRLRQLYLSDLEGWLARDRQDYSTALARVTGGMKPVELARAYSRSWDNYVEADLLPADLARELGVQEKTLVATFKAYAQAKGSIDPVLAAVIQTPPLPVLRDHWEEVYPVAQEILLGAKR
jgi:hypothetical protein